ncbi:MAG TPA: retention module-containing protein, partial [Methylophilaceae bacterium]|nr:retention module-containing protein [Methylophilaceae bacterium]
MAVLGTVVAVNGEAFVVDQNGNKRIIKLGDTIQPGDTIITPPGIVVELQLVTGRSIFISGNETVQLTQDLIDAIQPDSGDSAVDLATIQSVIRAIEEGRDIGEVVEETAAGLDGAVFNNYGFSFLELLRIDEVLNQFDFEFDRLTQDFINTQQIPGRTVGGLDTDEINTFVPPGTVPPSGAANRAPSVASDTFVVAEDGSITIDVLANDSDPEGNPLTITSVDGQAIIEGGPAVLVPNG